MWGGVSSPEEGPPQTVVLTLGQTPEALAHAFKNSKVGPHAPDIRILTDLGWSPGIGIS